MNPETIDPPWFQDLVRKALDRELRRLLKAGCDSDAAWEQAMWFVFDIRTDLTALYQAAAAEPEAQQ
jgi:hypothetical protein